MTVSVAVGKAGHTGAHISPASCTDLACLAFLFCLVDRNVADFVDDSGLALEISSDWVSQALKNQKAFPKIYSLIIHVMSFALTLHLAWK